MTTLELRGTYMATYLIYKFAFVERLFPSFADFASADQAYREQTGITKTAFKAKKCSSLSTLRELHRLAMVSYLVRRYRETMARPCADRRQAAINAAAWMRTGPVWVKRRGRHRMVYLPSY